MKPAACLATVFLGIVALAHLLRLLLRQTVRIASFDVPRWMSLAAFLFCGALAVWLYRESHAAV